ncbi:hypothetical protein CO666_05030 [Rhizobium chutanense]|uniref:Uncharacterized protein n=1 Tax=Rhizobium chutanense TaxID=2035448 RepID=A0A2A6JFN3_9HYPH|nr:hypothetical protein CO666_05030 [Rhizobium chutanense]
MPPFKAFGEIAQDLIADAILGVTAHMGDNSPPARRFAEAPSKIAEILGENRVDCRGASTLACQPAAAIANHARNICAPNDRGSEEHVNGAGKNWSG